MKIPVTDVLDLLHRCAWGSLASHSTQLPGYPYATALPYVLDAGHSPVFLISGLAEHTRNVKADPRASLMVADSEAGNVLLSARLSLMGDVTAFDPPPAFIDRYLRYQPDASRYLELGDFAFYRLLPQRLRLIAGFGQMGWLAPETWQSLVSLDPDDEQDLVARLEQHVPPQAQLLGLDHYGLDLQLGSRRRRLPFGADAVPVAELEAAAERVLAEFIR